MHEPEDQKQEVAELSDYLRVIRERAFVIILVTVVLVAGALIFSFRSIPEYRASSELLYKTNTLDQALVGTQVFSNSNQPRDVQTGSELVKLDTVAVAVRKRLSSSLSSEQLLEMITVTPSADTNIIHIDSVSIDPGEAADVANAFAEQFVLMRRDADRATVAAARQLVKDQLGGLSPLDASSDYGLMLKDKYETLQILEAMQTGGFSLVQSAVPPSSPFTPQPTRNGGLALVVGVVLGLGLAFLLNYLDRRIKDVKSLERIFGLPVLASIPAVGGRWRGSYGAKRSLRPVGFVSHPSVLEPFRTLRSSLQYFAVEKRIKTILITSGLPCEGKTVTAVNLALSLVLAGNRVVIVEADLRRPMAPHYLGLDNRVGLSTLLAGATTLGEALQVVNLDALLPDEVRENVGGVKGIPLEKSLLCLAAGPLPPNPAELLSSDRMGKLLEELSQNPGVNYVVIDTPPILSVADALVIAPKADAIVIATRVNWTTREEAEEVSRQLRRSGARVIGVVAGGVRGGSGYYGRTGYRQYGYGR